MLGANPEMKYTENQQVVANLSVATSDKGKIKPDKNAIHL
jgi:single-stranded DNA-binding protein